RATSADNLALLIHKGFGGSNRLPSANQSRQTEIFEANRGIVPHFCGQFPLEGDQRRELTSGCGRNPASFSLWWNGSVPIAPFTFNPARWFPANGWRCFQVF